MSLTSKELSNQFNRFICTFFYKQKRPFIAEFYNMETSYRKEFAPRGSESFPLREVFYGMKNNSYHIRPFRLFYTIFIMHEMGATAMKTVFNYLLLDSVDPVKALLILHT